MTSGSFCLPRPSLLVIFERFFTARPARPASAARPPALFPPPPPLELFLLFFFEPPSRPARPARPLPEPELFFLRDGAGRPKRAPDDGVEVRANRPAPDALEGRP